MTDPYRTPAKIAADIPRRPFDWSWWFPFFWGAFAATFVALLVWRALAIREMERRYPPPMHVAPRGDTMTSDAIRIETSPTYWASFPGETISLVCNGKLATTCDDTATIEHGWRTLDAGNAKSPDPR